MNPNIEIPFARPQLGKEEESAVLEVMRSGWLTTGKQALAFEREFASYLGIEHALAVNSATAGLHLALTGLGVGPGDKVILPVFTFTATAAAVHYTGAEVVFADIDRKTLNLSPETLLPVLEQSDRSKIKAIITVHYAGLPCNMQGLKEIAGDIPIIEDAAHAFPVGTEQGIAGTLGRVGVFSFYANKTITTGEGGMVVTDDQSLALKVKRSRLQGIDRDVWGRYTDKKSSWQYDVVDLGFKYNLPDIAAAIGRVQLKRAADFKSARTKIAKTYIAGLQNTPFTLPAPGEDHAWHLFVLRTQDGPSPLDRDRVIETLNKKGIGTSVHFIPLHLLTYYKNRYNLAPESFPEALHAFRSCFSIPIYPGMTGKQVDRVIQVLRQV